jgi:hypothetical protein
MQSFAFKLLSEHRLTVYRKDHQCCFYRHIAIMTVNAEVTMHLSLFQMIALYCSTHRETYTN